MTFKPHPVLLSALALVIGGAAAAGLIWLFGIEVSEPARLAVFPSGWTMLELVWNATAVILVVGCVRACYVALHAHFYGDKDADPPPTGTGGY